MTGRPAVAVAAAAAAVLLTPLIVIVLFLGTSGPGTAGAAAAQAPAAAAAAAPAGSVPAGTGEAAFVRAVLTDLGAPGTAANVSSVEAWIRRETPWPPVAANNPLNSTLAEAGSTPFNFLAGGGSVQNYPTAAEGASADAATIANGRYQQIDADLRAGAGLCSDPGLATDFETWSGGGYDSPDC